VTAGAADAACTPLERLEREVARTFVDLDIGGAERSPRVATLDGRRLPDLASLVESLLGPQLNIRDVRAVRGGKALGEQSFVESRITEPRAVRKVVSRRRLEALLDQGDTVVVNNVDLYVEPIARMAVEAERAFGCRVSSNVLITEAGFTGFPLHTDDRDAFVVQVSGCKTWMFAEFPSGLERRTVVTREFAEENARPVAEFELEAGQVLALPAGILHRARATDTASVHCSFTLLRPRFGEFLRAVADGASPTVREEVPYAALLNADGLDSWLEQKTSELGRHDGFSSAVSALRREAARHRDTHRGAKSSHVAQDDERPRRFRIDLMSNVPERALARSVTESAGTVNARRAAELVAGCLDYADADGWVDAPVDADSHTAHALIHAFAVHDSLLEVDKA
jgi:Cupin superfamily protein